MVNTFVPYDDVNKCAGELDWRRLGKQRVEAYQIWRCLKGYTRGWRGHPAVKAWEGHEGALAVYCNAMIREWVRRGYRNTMSFLPHGERTDFPWWWGWAPVHMSHRAALKRKLGVHYRYEVGEYMYWGYVWPTKVPLEMRGMENPSLDMLNLEKIEMCERGRVHGLQKVIQLKASGTTLPTNTEMASYGRQFELLMTSIGIDLINAYNNAEQPGDVAEFVRNFFNSETPGTPPHFPRPSSPLEAPAKGKGAKGKGAKGKGPAAPKKETTPPPDEKRCAANTAKGARCMKCVKDGEVFCSVHLKNPENPKPGPEAKGKAAKGKGKGKVVAEPEPEAVPSEQSEAEAAKAIAPPDEASTSRVAQIFQEASKADAAPRKLKPARAPKKAAQATPAPAEPEAAADNTIVPLTRAEAVRPSWFDQGEEAEDSSDPTWQLGEEDFDEDDEEGQNGDE
jgi:hypothetical protein